jgi:hypothetical protein
MTDTEDDRIALPKSDVIAISRLLWEVGSQDTTGHQHKVDCFHWGARLDKLAGLPPHPTGGQPTEEVIAFYEQVRDHVDGVLSDLRNWDQA